MIPKVIHYCWFGRNSKPSKVLNYIDGWKSRCPDYEIKEWNEDNFDVNYNRFTQEAYREKKYAFVADVARLYILAKEGGIYLDTDIEVIKPFDDLLHRDYFIGYECFETIGTGVIGAMPNVGFIVGFLNTYNDRLFINANHTYNEEPNTLLLKNYLQKEKFNLNIYDVDYFCAKNYQTGKIECTQRTYCIHHYSASWKPWYAKLEKRICNLLGLKYHDYLFRYLSR